MKRIAFATALATLLAVPAFAQPAGHPAFGTWGVDLTAMDKSVKPGDDFFRLRQRHLAEDRRHPARPRQHRLLPGPADPQREADAGDRGRLEARPRDQLTVEEGKLRDLYDAFMDQKQIDARGLRPAQKDLDYIAR